MQPRTHSLAHATGVSAPPRNLTPPLVRCQLAEMPLGNITHKKKDFSQPAGEATYEVDEIFVHAEYQGPCKGYSHDIAIIKYILITHVIMADTVMTYRVMAVQGILTQHRHHQEHTYDPCNCGLYSYGPCKGYMQDMAIIK